MVYFHVYGGGDYYSDTGFILKAEAKEIFPLKGTIILNQLSC